jgi:hypothetical protein
MMNDEWKIPTGGRGEIVIFQEAQGRPGLEVRLEQESVWLSLNQLAALFERDKSFISRHLRILDEKEHREELEAKALAALRIGEKTIPCLSRRRIIYTYLNRWPDQVGGQLAWIIR